LLLSKHTNYYCLPSFGFPSKADPETGGLRCSNFRSNSKKQKRELEELRKREKLIFKSTAMSNWGLVFLGTF
jgi:hypothetical protein